MDSGAVAQRGSVPCVCWCWPTACREWRSGWGAATPLTSTLTTVAVTRVPLQADELEGSVDPDAAQPVEPRGEGEPSTSYSSSSSGEQQAGLVRRPKSALRRYVESFDQETMMETARWVGGVQWRG